MVQQSKEPEAFKDGRSVYGIYVENINTALAAQYNIGYTEGAVVIPGGNNAWIVPIAQAMVRRALVAAE